MYDKGKFVRAYFVQGSRDTVRAFWKPNNSNELQEVLAETLPGIDRGYDAILKDLSLDDIERETNENEKVFRQQLANFYMAEAEKKGFVYDSSVVEPNKRLNFDWLFELPEGTEGQDFLFELKLRLFDDERIASSSDADTKKKMRDADNVLDAMYYAGKLIHE